MLRRLAVLLSLVLVAALLVSPGAAAQPRDDLKVALWTRVETLNVYGTTQLIAYVLGDHLYDGLLRRNAETQTLEPALAVSWERLDDVTWEFRLREGVRFHNGQPLTAHAVKATFDAVKDPENRQAAGATLRTWLDKVEVVDDYTVRITTLAPDPILLERLAFQHPIYPADYAHADGLDRIGAQPVGTGPYKFRSWTRGHELVFEANEDYWGPVPEIKTLTFRIIPEDATVLAEFLSGGIDVVARVNPDHLPAYERMPGAKIISSPSTRMHFVQMDSMGRGGDTPFVDKRVRQAVNYAIDRDTIVSAIKRGYGVALYTPLVDAYFGANPEQVTRYEYNPEKARALLAEAGYPNGFKTTLYGYFQREVLEAVAGYLQEVGIDAEIAWYGENESVLINMRNSGQLVGPAMFTWGVNIYDAAYVLPFWFGAGSAMNYNEDPALVSLINEAGSIFDRDARLELYTQAQNIIMEEAYWAPVFAEVSIYAVPENLEFVSIGEYPRFAESRWMTP